MSLPPYAYEKCLPKNTKQQIICARLKRQIQQQDYLTKMYDAQIQMIEKQKQQLQNNFIRSGKSCLQNSMMKRTFRESRAKNLEFSSLKKISSFEQSKVFENSSSLIQSPLKRLSGTNNKIQSPIKQLDSMASSNNFVLKKIISTVSPLEHKNHKIQQLLKEIDDLQNKIKAKQSKILKANSHEVSDNLLQKIKKQEEDQQSELRKWKQLQINLQVKHKTSNKMERIHEEVYRQSEGLKVIKNQVKNRNKEIIRQGYTNLMLQLIQSYQGIRK